MVHIDVQLVIFVGLIFCGLKSSDNFVGLYFRGVPTIISYIAEIQISRVHEIHENLNPTEITNHTVCRQSVNKPYNILVMDAINYAQD